MRPAQPSAGRALAIPPAQLRVVMAYEPALTDLTLRTFLLRRSLLIGRGVGLTLIGSRFNPDTGRLLQVLAPWAPDPQGGAGQCPGQHGDVLRRGHLTAGAGG